MVLLKRWMALLAAFLMLLCSCTGNTPEKTTADFLNCLIKSDIKSAEKLTLSGNLLLDTGSKDAAAIYKPLFSAIQYSVGGSLIDGEMATVNITLLVIDLEELMSQVSLEVVQKMVTSGKGSGDLFYTLLLEKLTAEDVPMASYTVTAELIKEAGRWKIDMDRSPDFLQAVGGGVEGLILTS